MNYVHRCAQISHKQRSADGLVFCSTSPQLGKRLSKHRKYLHMLVSTFETSNIMDGGGTAAVTGLGKGASPEKGQGQPHTKCKWCPRWLSYS